MARIVGFNSRLEELILHPTRPRSSLARSLAVAALAFVIPACGGDSEQQVAVYRASGKVTFDGKPLANAIVLLRKPEADPKVPSPIGTTGEDGSFTLHTYETGDGAPEGDYLVGISMRPPNRDTGGGGSRKDSQFVDVLKGRYADPKSSGLKATIKPGENSLPPFDLTTTGGADPQSFVAPRDHR